LVNGVLEISDFQISELSLVKNLVPGNY